MKYSFSTTYMPVPLCLDLVGRLVGMVRINVFTNRMVVRNLTFSDGLITEVIDALADLLGEWCRLPC